MDFSNTFGQTETLGAYAALTPEDHRRGDRFDSVGRPLAGVELRIVEPGTEQEVDPGGVGEFVVRADAEHHHEWLHTGDTGRQDDEGYLYLVGRLSDTINRGGEKFGPVEVEEVLRTHPSVVDAGVVGLPDADLGERVGAMVVVSEPVTVEELLQHCARGVGHLQGARVSRFHRRATGDRPGQTRPPGAPGPAGRRLPGRTADVLTPAAPAAVSRRRTRAQRHRGGVGLAGLIGPLEPDGVARVLRLEQVAEVRGRVDGRAVEADDGVTRDHTGLPGR